MLFSRCKLDTQPPMPAHCVRSEDIPSHIIPYVRHLTALGPFSTEEHHQRFQLVLSHLPALTSITLDNTMGHIPWTVLHTCLVHPRIVSLSFSLHGYGLQEVPISRDDLASTPITLKTFAYTPTMWREWESKGTNLIKVYTRELRFLANLIPLMNKTATSLALPMEFAPIISMASVPWPQLRELTLHGRFVVLAQSSSLRLLLRSLPALRVLSVQAARSRRIGRQPLLPPVSHDTSSTGHRASSDDTEQVSSPAPLLPELRSLTIAFPDPRD
ncbi:hypothetical protein BD310DRAFT_697619 [Dichomitus squalens]|uniref:F-box domain-containing protein n=1 Tax=Dichomitus squalens TaxID=114155 RepID=A0A4Q9Q5U6_9APHY|nr:hypothetical protein BD310DRAFT_697619 [Dichomitus squalens]